jgi:hypothetical protein
MQKDLQWYAKVPVQGISTYAEPGDWCTYELNHYVLAALAWDPDADVDAIVKKFCAARYGNSGELARSILLNLENQVRKYSSIPNTSLKNADEISKLQTVVDGFVKVLVREDSNEPEAAAKRALQRLQLICEYFARDLEIQHLRATRVDNESIRKKADELHEWLSSHADDGVFLIKDQRISPQRMQRRYGTGAAATQRSGG